MSNKKVVIIGGGVAGVMAGIKIKELNSNIDVVILEKTNNIGKKLRITGKGRCNITFEGDFEYFKKNITTNPKFMYSSYHNFTNYDLIKFVNDLGVKTKLERGNRYFLSSDDANELADKLKDKLNKLGIKVKYNETVLDIGLNSNVVKNVKTDQGFYDCDYVIIATGGMSYPTTGSSGDGYRLASKLGHNIVNVRPALVGVKSNDKICKELQGLNLKNVEVKVTNNNKEIFKDFGEMLFTHFGMSGPIILSSSSVINKVVDEKSNNICMHIDLKHALSFESLDKRIQRDFTKYANKEFKNSLVDLLPKSLIDVVIKLSLIDEDKKVHQITKEERLRVVTLLKDFKINVTGLMPIESGIVTSGGINLKEINPKTLESRLIKGLYFAGEVIDVDAFTGGFNLQIAFSTGNSVAMSIHDC